MRQRLLAAFVATALVAVAAPVAAGRPTKKALTALAKKTVAAVASGKFANLAKLMSPTARKELDRVNRDDFGKLRERLATEKIDLKACAFEGISETAGVAMIMVDITLRTPEKRRFELHMTATTLPKGKLSLVGVARWIRWKDGKK